MFQKILTWIRGVIDKMLNTSSVKSAMHVDVAISGLMAEALQLWMYMYDNRASWLNNEVKTLNLPASIAGEIARATTIEMKVTIDGSPRADYLAGQFANVLPRLRTMVEFGAAKGGLMFKPYINGKSISVDYVQADQFYPAAFDANGNITSCIFSDQRTVGDKFYTRMEYHRMTPAGCEIKNVVFKSSSRDALGQQVQLTEVDAWADLLPEAVITDIDKPLFAYFKYPAANNIDTTSPLGVSCFSRAVELIQQADEQWSSLIWEFESGKRAIYVDELAFGKDARTGLPVLPNKRLYRTLGQGGQVSDEEMFHEWTPEFREASILSGLDAILKRIEFVCGLAYGTLSDPQSVDKTATEIKISRQRTYATITDTQKSLQEALEQLLYAMDIWATIGNLAPQGLYQTAYDFDDSVIVDKDLQFQQDMRLVTSRLMSDIEFRMRNFGETEQQAKDKPAMIKAPDTSLFQGA